MKICLINPPHPYLNQPSSQAPLGLMYIASMLRSKGYSVDLLDLTDCKYDDNFYIPEANLYGITGTVIDRQGCDSVAINIRKNHPKSKIVLGGPITLTRMLLDVSLYDAVVIGEGEYEIFKVIDDFDTLGHKKEYFADRIEDLDKIPFPARDMLLYQGGNVFAYNKNYIGSESTVIITSRGCPFSCAFCASPGIWGRRVSYRSIGNVLQEVDEIIEKHGIRQLRFSDDNLTLNENRLYELCDGLQARSVAWRASIRVKPNSANMFQRMLNSGCKEVSFGIESGDDDVLLQLRKGATVEDNRKAIMNAKKAGLVVRILFMINTPGETIHTVNKNIDFLKTVDYDTIALTSFIPIPGSDISKNPSKYGCRIVDTDIDKYNFYLWGPNGEREWSDLVSINGLSKYELSTNRMRMREYIISTGKSNRG